MILFPDSFFANFNTFWGHRTQSHKAGSYLHRVFECSALHLPGQLFIESISLLLLANGLLLHLQFLLLSQLGYSLLATLSNLLTKVQKTFSVKKTNKKRLLRPCKMAKCFLCAYGRPCDILPEFWLSCINLMRNKFSYTHVSGLTNWLWICDNSCKELAAAVKLFLSPSHGYIRTKQHTTKSPLQKDHRVISELTADNQVRDSSSQWFMSKRHQPISASDSQNANYSAW